MRAGLAMQAAMDEINERIAADIGANFALRVGINSGEVLAGRVGDGYTVIGDPVNVAARLQAAAKPGTVIVGEVTHRLTRAAIEYVELEPLELKGKAEPVPAWEAVRAVVRGRATRAAGSSAPLVGRDDESELLLSLFDRVADEQPPAPGDRDRPGRASASRGCCASSTRASATAGAAPAVRLGSCPAYGAGLAYWALGEIVRGTFDIVDTDDAESPPGASSLRGVETPRRAQRRAARAARRRRSGDRSGSSRPRRPGRAAVEPTIRSRCASACSRPCARWSRRPAARQPLVFAVEDIHWADEGMLDLIEHLARWARGPVLIVCLARDELLDRRPGLGRRADRRDDDHARSARPRAGARAGRRAARRRGRVRGRSPSRSPCARAATPCSPRRWSTGSSRRAPATPRRCPRRCTRCSPRGSTRSRAPSGGCSRSASVVGQTFWEGSVGDGWRAGPRSARRRSNRCAARTSWCRRPAAASPASASTPSSTS